MSGSTFDSRVRTLAGILALTLVFVAVAAQGGGDPYLCTCGGSDGGGSEDSLAKYNTTAILDRNASGGPVIAGQYVVGDIMNQVYVNLTNDTSYTVVNADNIAIANVTAKANEIMLQEYDVNALGTWALYKESDWDALGLLADPLLTYEITDGPTDASTGSFVQTVGPASDIVDQVTVCDGEVSRSASVTRTNGTSVNVSVPSSGGHVAIKMTWETYDLKPEGIGVFQMWLGDRKEDRPLGADARATAENMDGVLRTVKELDPGSSVKVNCEARGDGYNSVDSKEVTVNGVD